MKQAAVNPSPKKTKKKTKTVALSPRTNLEVIQINNMFKTMQEILLSGFSDEGWGLATRIQQNLAGFVFQKEREDLGRLVADCYIGIDNAEIVERLANIKAAILK